MGYIFQPPLVPWQLTPQGRIGTGCLSADALEKLKAESLTRTEELIDRLREFKERGVTKEIILDLINRVYDNERTVDKE